MRKGSVGMICKACMEEMVTKWRTPDEMLENHFLLVPRCLLEQVLLAGATFSPGL